VFENINAEKTVWKKNSWEMYKQVFSLKTVASLGADSLGWYHLEGWGDTRLKLFFVAEFRKNSKNDVGKGEEWWGDDSKKGHHFADGND